jgi:hypothetical protein
VCHCSGGTVLGEIRPFCLSFLNDVPDGFFRTGMCTRSVRGASSAMEAARELLLRGDFDLALAASVSLCFTFLGMRFAL